MKIINWLFVALVFVALALTRAVVVALGLAVVPLALIWARTEPPDRPAIWPQWQVVRLPWWAWPWDNLRDGAIGDRRGDYWLKLYPAWFNVIPWASAVEFLKCFYWLAIRNPANNFSRFVPPFSCDLLTRPIITYLGKRFVRDRPGYEGWQFVTARGPVFKYFGFYGVWRLFRWLLVVRLGHKIEPRHATADWSGDDQAAIKGFTFRVSIKSAA